MIDFRPFYQQIATTNLSAWLETLPLQLKEWEKQTHGDYAKWSKIVDFLPDLQADTIDLKNAVKSDRTSPLSEGEKQRIIHHLKQLMATICGEWLVKAQKWSLVLILLSFSFANLKRFENY